MSQAVSTPAGLQVLREEIAARCAEIAANQPTWPCRRGCDSCCRSLAAPPRATALEWDLLKRRFLTLPASRQSEIRQRIATLKRSPQRPITCPFLDLEAGACQVYEHRPLACRTYGFYVERDKGLYCEEIRKREDAGEFSLVVWGNQTSIDARSSDLGESLELTEIEL